MEEFKVCKICFSKDVKLYDSSRLQAIYLRLIAYQVQYLHQYFCYECAAYLLKYEDFRMKCLRSYDAQENITKLGKFGKALYDFVIKLDRNSFKLNSSLSMGNSKFMSILENIDQKFNDNYFDMVCTDIHDTTNEDFKTPTKDLPLFDNKEEVSINTNENQTEIEIKSEFVYEAFQLEFILPNDSTGKDESDNETSFAEQAYEVPANVEPVYEVPNESKIKNLKKLNPKKAPKRQRRGKKKGVPDAAANERTDDNFISHCVDRKKWCVTRLSEGKALMVHHDKSNGSWYMRAPYKCSTCYKGFSEEDMLKRHMELNHNPKYELECSICKIRINRHPNKLRKHKLCHYYQFKCLQCSFETMICSSAAFHEKTHSAGGKSCRLCGESFLHTSSYYTHLRVIHPSEHLCTLCGKSFVSQNGVNFHMRRTHLIVTAKEKKKNNEKPKDAPTIKREQSDDKLYCKTCDITFLTSEAFDNHLYSSAKHNETEKRSRNKFSRQLGVRKNSRYHHYPKTENNIIIKDGAKKIVSMLCELCDTRFKTFKDLADHHQLQHDGLPFNSFDRVICEICGKYIKFANLSVHKNIHTREIVYECHQCRRQFLMKSALIRHMLTHTGEKPHKCKLCDKRYQQTASLDLHVKTAHLKQPYPKRLRRPPCHTSQKSEDV